MLAGLKLHHLHRQHARALTMIAIATAAMPAKAQLQKFNARLTDVQVGLIGLGAVIFTIAFLWVSYKMAYDHAKWGEVSRVFLAGVIAASASALAGWLLG